MSESTRRPGGRAPAKVRRPSGDVRRPSAESVGGKHGGGKSGGKPIGSKSGGSKSGGSKSGGSKPGGSKPGGSKPGGSKPGGGRSSDRRPNEGKSAVAATAGPVGAGAERLQKLLAQAGIASRRAAEELIAAGRVRVDGRVVTTLGTRVDPELASVEVDGQRIAAQQKIVVVMNKPDETVSSAEAKTDPRGRATVVSLLGGLGTRVVPVGRLDYHTRGVLLLTNDGTLAAALTHPTSGVPKTYHVKFQGRLDENALAHLHAGVQLEDGTRTRPSLEVELVKATTTNTWVQMTIAQGLNRQIRRMGEAIGHSVLKLIRVAFAGITADGLREGQWRVLREDEVGALRKLAGLTRRAKATAVLKALADALDDAPRRRPRLLAQGQAVPARRRATVAGPAAAATAQGAPRPTDGDGQATSPARDRARGDAAPSTRGRAPAAPGRRSSAANGARSARAGTSTSSRKGGRKRLASRPR